MRRPYSTARLKHDLGVRAMEWRRSWTGGDSHVHDERVACHVARFVTAQVKHRVGNVDWQRCETER